MPGRGPHRQAPDRRPPLGARSGPRARGGDPAPEILYGLHPVLEAVESGRRTIDRILVSREGTAAGLGRVLRRAREDGVPITHLSRRALLEKVGRGALHQGIAAIVSAFPYADPDALCRSASNDPTALLVVVDGVEDPRNLGAIVRTAVAAGAFGLIVSSERSAGLTAAVAKASAGTLEKIEVARDAHLARRLDRLRASGFRLLALDAAGDAPWDGLTLNGRNVVVAGGEGRGLRRDVAEHCDHRVTIPLAGGVESLNVSVAVALVLYEIVRQRRSDRRERSGTP